MVFDEKKIEQHIKILGCTREEAMQIMEDDYAIDHGEKLFELTDEQKKVAKEMCRADSEKQIKKGSGIPKKRAKKVDDDKTLLVDTILKSIEEVSTDIKVVNEGREYTCCVNGKKFKIAISQPRS